MAAKKFKLISFLIPLFGTPHSRHFSNLGISGKQLGYNFFAGRAETGAQVNIVTNVIDT